MESMNYTAHVAAMLVLTTMFINVSNNLPKTSYVKMIDVWLLFGLILPFLGFILSIFEELVAQAQEDADTGRVKVELQNNL